MTISRQYALGFVQMLALSAVCVAAYPAKSWAVIVPTYDSSTTSELEYPVSGSDLINTGQSTLASVTHDDFITFDGTDITKLNDGTAGLSVFAPTNNGWAAAKPTVAGVDMGGVNYSEWTSTFELSLTDAPYGYDITSVQSISGWPDNRSSQRYELLLSTVGDPGFTSFGVFSLLAPNGSNSTRITLEDSSGVIASGVDAVRFHFYNGSPLGGGAPSELVYREFDVFGVPSSTPVPEPSGLLIIAITIAGLTFNRKVCVTLRKLGSLGN